MSYKLLSYVLHLNYARTPYYSPMAKVLMQPILQQPSPNPPFEKPGPVHSFAM